jgi:SAM-dependent methyltransferase
LGAAACYSSAMDEITRTLKTHHESVFELHGATARGVDWGAEGDVSLRYDKMLAVLQKDFADLPLEASILDVGCGWGGLLRRARSLGIPLRYTGIDVVGAMIEHGRKEFADAEFIQADIFELDGEATYDFVVCCGVAFQKLSATIPEFERFTRRLIRRMFELSRHGIALNMMSTRVNFRVENLYYQNPSELLCWLLSDVSPRVRIDHGYSSLTSGIGRYYDFTTYVYKD